MGSSDYKKRTNKKGALDTSVRHFFCLPARMIPYSPIGGKDFFYV